MKTMKEFLVIQEAFFAVTWAESKAGAVRKFEELGIGARGDRDWKRPRAELLVTGKEYML